MVDIVVAGAAGRMGARIIACLGEAPDLRLVAALEASGHPALGTDAGDIAGVGRRGVPVTADATAALTAGRMLVEFSTPDATLEHLRMAAGAGVRAVIGTTGFSPRQRDEIRDLSSKAAILLSPNMSVGVTLALRLLATMAKALGVFSLRSGDVVGEHTVSFGAPGERLELTHRAHSRDTFARGALRAVRFIATRPPG